MRKDNFETLPYFDELLKKVYAFYATIWADRRQEGIHKDWIENFALSGEPESNKCKLNALYLLSKFMYFGNIEVREMLKCVYRDLFKYEVVKSIRSAAGDTHDLVYLEQEFSKELRKTRFLGVGNPSESGVHLLYYFRQENRLPKELFWNTHEIFRHLEKEEAVEDCIQKDLVTELADPKIRRYIFIDDFCVSGTQAKEYSKDIVEAIKKKDKDIEVNYLMLFSTLDGLQEIRKKTKFDITRSIYTIDNTFRCFSDNSRYYPCSNADINKDFFKEICRMHGQKLFPSHPLGYKDGQLLMGLFHNTPDNSLPIFWSEEDNWAPIFRRYPKI